MSRLRTNLALLLAIPLLVSSTSCIRKYSVAEPAAPTINSNDYTPALYKEDLKKYNEATDLGLAKQKRNEIVYSLLASIDDLYGQYTVRLYAGKGAEAVSMDSLSLGLTSAATIAANPATKTIMSALGTAFTGVGLSVDKNFFAQQTFQVLAVAMQTRRDKIRTSMISNLALDTTTYPLAAAKRDLVAYYYAGTLSGGLQELQEESGTSTAANASGKIPAPAPTLPPKPPPTPVLERVLTPH